VLVDMAQCSNGGTSFWGAFQIMPQDVLLKILELEPNSLLAISSLNTKFRKLLLEKKLWDKVYKSLKINLGLTKGELLLDANDNWRLTYVSVRPYEFADHLPKPKKGKKKQDEKIIFLKLVFKKVVIRACMVVHQ
jgi:hypothetical protein